MIDTNANEDNTAPSAPIQGAKSGGSAYWRSLDHVADTAEFAVHALGFPRGFGTDVRRPPNLPGHGRPLLAGIGLADVAVGRSRNRTVRQPSRRSHPGEAEHYATAWEFAGQGVPMVAASMDGRPVKLEGHESFYGGGTDSFAQATCLICTTSIAAGGSAKWCPIRLVGLRRVLRFDLAELRRQDCGGRARDVWPLSQGGQELFLGQIPRHLGSL